MVNIDNDRKAVCTCFGNGEWEKGRKKLFMMYNTKLNKLDNIEDIRFIIHNLAWVEHYLGNKENSRMYITEIKDIFESNEQHIKDYSSEYCKVLDLYNISHTNIITNDEKIKLYEKTHAIHCKINSPDRYMALHNIYDLKKEYCKSVNLLKEMLYDIGEHQQFLDTILKDLKEKDEESYKKSLLIVEEYKLSNTSVINS